MPSEPRNPEKPTNGEGTSSSASPGPSQERPESLAERKRIRASLMEEVERQSDGGALNVDVLVDLYHKEYADPLFNIVEDVQTLISVYSNVFEALKKDGDVAEAAAMLKDRYTKLGLIPERNEWPNPLADRLMRHCLDKLHQYRKALLDVLRTRGRQLIRELNFDPTMSVSFQLSLGTDTSFAISVQPTVSVGPNP